MVTWIYIIHKVEYLQIKAFAGEFVSELLTDTLPDIIDPIVQALPESVLVVRVPHEETVDEDGDEDLDDDLHTEGGHCQYPGAEGEMLPQRHNENTGGQY